MEQRNNNRSIRKRPNLPPSVNRNVFVKTLNRLGRNKTAIQYGISKATVYQWAKAFGLKAKKTIIWY